MLLSIRKLLFNFGPSGSDAGPRRFFLRPYIPGSILALGLLGRFNMALAEEVEKFTVSEPVVFAGEVDGSAGIDVGNGFFIGATDEKNLLHLYNSKDGTKTQVDIDMEAAVKKALGAAKIKECDLEGAARIGDMVYWAGSFGRNKDAEEKKERQVLIATQVSGQGAETKLKIVGVYTKLLDDLLLHPALKPFNLADAARKAPKDDGALNIESLAADGGHLLIGFRNPKIAGQSPKPPAALLVPLMNPEALFIGGNDVRAELGQPMLLGFDGLGFRDMAPWDKGFLILAGASADRFDQDAKPSQLFFWKSGDGPPRNLQVDLGDLNPEAIIVTRHGAEMRPLILSDDGKYPARQGEAFRGVWLQSARPETARVASWNVACGRGGTPQTPQGKPIPQDRIERLGKVIAEKIRPDVLLLSEVWDRDAAGKIAAASTAAGFKLEALPIPDQPPDVIQLLAVLKRPEVKVEDLKVIDGSEDILPGSQPEEKASRKAVCASVAVGTFDFHLIGVHLKSKLSVPAQKLTPAEMRDRQCWTLAPHIQEVTVGKEKDVLLIGDYNMTPKAELPDGDESDQRNFDILSSGTDLNFISSGLKGPTHLGIYKGQVERVKLDGYAITKAAMNEWVPGSFQILNAGILGLDESRFYDKNDPAFLSDHYPIAADFRIDGIDDD
ncbi:MAG: DUF3616 domain-containing protein [Verrucomicrobiaceae bacterium]|nr:MAG: DUF3616 domain-containing protein [Verrucomicrobiaceae bacterium]